ncbi:hypothetical protein BDM02DRAFT_459475 [Thelephora ganbajun]|uniref:Uncharacterized protein n=1 Tax=Thelephora ganbajun TaxID=370292 RepID=A0ACB6ZRB4_THEGA|nr:hypothetical protein BDM02DRAFT_459475 [Thelephora ganbajun]
MMKYWSRFPSSSDSQRKSCGLFNVAGLSSDPAELLPVPVKSLSIVGIPSDRSVARMRSFLELPSVSTKARYYVMQHMLTAHCRSGETECKLSGCNLLYKITRDTDELREHIQTGHLNNLKLPCPIKGRTSSDSPLQTGGPPSNPVTF